MWRGVVGCAGTHHATPHPSSAARPCCTHKHMPPFPPCTHTHNAHAYTHPTHTHNQHALFLSHTHSLHTHAARRGARSCSRRSTLCRTAWGRRWVLGLLGPLGLLDLLGCAPDVCQHGRRARLVQPLQGGVGGGGGQLGQRCGLGRGHLPVGPCSVQRAERAWVREPLGPRAAAPTHRPTASPSPTCASLPPPPSPPLSSFLSFFSCFPPARSSTATPTRSWSTPPAQTWRRWSNLVNRSSGRWVLAAGVVGVVASGVRGWGIKKRTKTRKRAPRDALETGGTVGWV